MRFKQTARKSTGGKQIPSPQQPSPQRPITRQNSPRQPAPLQPAPRQPATRQPDPLQPAPLQPAPLQPAPRQPDPLQPAPLQPAPRQPATRQPDPLQPAPLQPAPRQPAPRQPDPLQPSSEEEKGTARKSTTKSVTNDQQQQVSATPVSTRQSTAPRPPAVKLSVASVVPSASNASKSTASIITPPRLGDRAVQIARDPVKGRIKGILATKRKSITPKMGVPGGKRISMNDGPPKTRNAPGTVSLKEIRKFQGGYKLLLPRSNFHRLVRHVTQTLQTDPSNPYRYQVAALEALQEAAEAHLIQLFEDSLLCTIHAKRVTLFVEDIRLCRRLQASRMGLA